MKTTMITIASVFALALPAAAIDLTRHTVDGGGGSSSGGGFVLSATIGQHDAGYASGGSFDLTGGFWVALPGGTCPGDADGNGTIDLSDLSLVLSQFGQNGAGLEGDVNNDGAVDLSDLSEVLANFGASC